jgi:hypothetical protein
MNFKDSLALHTMQAGTGIALIAADCRSFVCATDSGRIESA